jgi:hypothetical protein
MMPRQAQIQPISFGSRRSATKDPHDATGADSDDPDDCATPPGGNSGARLGTGVIGLT